MFQAAYRTDQVLDGPFELESAHVLFHADPVLEHAEKADYRGLDAEGHLLPFFAFEHVSAVMHNFHHSLAQLFV